MLHVAAWAGTVAASDACDSSDPAAVAPDRRPSEFQAFIENDSFGDSDRYYTNGIRLGLGWRFQLLTDLACRLKTGFGIADRPSSRRISEVGVFIGQNLYTPRDISVAAPQPDDRPWAAWSYVAGVAQSRDDTNRILETLEVDLGMIGPAAGGRLVQTEWHKLVGARRPMGWSNQLPNEPGVLVSYLVKHRYGDGWIDVVPHLGVGVGNVMTFARAGATLRIGMPGSGYGVDTIEPGGAMLQGGSGVAGRGNEWFVFAGFDQRLVAHNVFLDGNLFRRTVGVDRRALVHDLSAGVSVRFKGVRFSLTRVRRSEEFSTAAGGGGRQFFHSINIGFEN